MSVTGKPGRGSMRARGAAAAIPGTGGSGVSGQRDQSPEPEEPGRGSSSANGSTPARRSAVSWLARFGVSSWTASTSTSCRRTICSSAAGSATPPRAFTLSTRTVSRAGSGATPDPPPVAPRPRRGPGGGNCQTSSTAAGIARRTASHHAVNAATSTAASAATAATGARAASCGLRTGPAAAGQPGQQRGQRHRSEE